jgi:hypothetical protein
MHLMYYLDANGKRVYTLKVSHIRTVMCTSRIYVVQYDYWSTTKHTFLTPPLFTPQHAL